MLHGQLTMAMIGAGGTGKSEVILAMRDFTQQWGMANSLCVVATTGIAACLIGGLTWQKATGHSSLYRRAAIRASNQTV